MAGTHVSRCVASDHGSRDTRTDPAVTAASLAAEAAFLDERLSLLREAIAAVDARMDEVSTRLRRLRRPTPGGQAPSGGEDDTGLDHSATDRL
ncbi:hypothetical protein [Streptomyces acidiscabies]|uniref:Uncharacterized protein n=1 Tax=Streptomyces acidiscabies TaxID=42234 RepID=A0AAP6EI08_9ACTN|nr:hypothetical protein [Streptomyces acidiscabies]MBZ3913603.1 hypothetical protein [Streptomyces acidiscabies]MDX2963439.1 hypothetical protein [Streptomyces acidiscabies]MDX3023173.1 hypothetical protein [Streptomyces acidiscabies]MDX3792681.1 hypothetical protein [Streptomyces acidiscabies]GAQ51374.1 hypothetical protein a10_01154 [Streptomyces acidiscabies]